MFQTKLVVNLANYTQNKTLFCDHVGALWFSLESVYTSADFKDDLVWTSAATTGYGFTDSILKTGHHLFDSVLHAQALGQLVEMAEKWSCGDPGPMRAVRQRIVNALQHGPLLWNDSVGMFRPSSAECGAPPCDGYNANLTDVWGSALAVDTGAVTGDRAARIVAWFGAHWGEVVQDGQIRHLPLGQHWASHAFWEYDVYQNGGYWGTASGWVLPIIARNNSEVAKQLVRDAINDCKRNGINEWHNREYCSNCKGPMVTQPTQPGGLRGQCEPSGLGCQAYPMRGDWYGGAMIYGPNIGSIWRAAQRLLPMPAPSPPPLPPPNPAPPPITPPPKGCNVTATWKFHSLTQPNAFECNNFTEAADGSLLLTPGRCDLRIDGNFIFVALYFTRPSQWIGMTVGKSRSDDCMQIGRSVLFTTPRIPSTTAPLSCASLRRTAASFVAPSTRIPGSKARHSHRQATPSF
eukprot:SAG31_NODE_2358_length_5873_cov_12.058019_1_plen_463_part_00